MAATLARQGQHRNVIVFPTDFYRKHTESSSSDSNFIPTHWQTTNPMDRTSHNKITSTFTRRTKGKPRHRVWRNPYQPLLSLHSQLSPTACSPYHNAISIDDMNKRHSGPHPVDDSSTTITPLDANNLSTTAVPEGISTPSSSSVSTLSSSTSLTSPLSSVRPHSTSISPQSSDSMSPSTGITDVSGPKIFLRIPTAALSKKRPISATAVPESPATTSRSEGSSSSGQKRLKIKLNLRSLSHAPLQPQLQPQPLLRQLAASDRAPKVIVISDDSDTQSVGFKSSLAENHDEIEPVTAMTLTQPDDAENHTCIELDPFLLRVVDTIFPEYEVKSRENLRHAYQVSEKLCDDYIVGRFLGSGSSGFVVSAKRVYDGAEVAIKIIPSDSKYTQSKFKRELDILNALTHENILGFVEYFEAPGFNFLVTDMGGSSLFDFIEAHKATQQFPDAERGANHNPFGSSIQENVIRSIFMQLSLAVHALHQNRIVHGDIKDENALVTMDNETGTYRARLCDFGHSKRVKHGDPPGFTFYGTTILSPPEMDANNALREKMKKSDFSVLDEDWQRFYGYEADVFAMGLMLYTMVHGDLPTELTEKNAKALAAYKRRRRSVKTFPFAILQQDLDNDLKDLLTRMLAVTPSRRMTMAEVINHPWLTRTS